MNLILSIMSNLAIFDRYSTSTQCSVPSYITPSPAADLCIQGRSGALEGVALQLVIVRKRVWQVTHSVPLPADIYVKDLRPLPLALLSILWVGEV